MRTTRMRELKLKSVLPGRKLALDFAFLGVVILPSARVNSEKGNLAVRAADQQVFDLT